MRNIIYPLILSILLSAALGFCLYKIDEKAKSTASFLENQILFQKKDDGIVVFNNEIKIKNSHR